MVADAEPLTLVDVELVPLAATAGVGSAGGLQLATAQLNQGNTASLILGDPKLTKDILHLSAQAALRGSFSVRGARGLHATWPPARGSATVCEMCAASGRLAAGGIHDNDDARGASAPA